MATLAEIRSQYPQYSDMSDEALANALHQKFYADMPREEFNQKVGFAPQSEELKAGMAELSAITQNPAKGQYDALPELVKPIVAANDALALFGNGATFGFGDKAVAGARSLVTGKSYEDELADARAKTNASRQRAGWAAPVAEFTGNAASIGRLAGAGLTLAGRGGTAAMTGLKGLGARTGLMGAEGAGYGALNALGNDQDVGEGAAVGAVGGMLGNVAGEAISSGVSKLAGLFNKKAPAPTAESLKATASRAYDYADKSGVAFNSAGVNKLRTGVIADLTERGFDPINEPGVMPVINRLNALGDEGNITIKGLDTLRKVASNGYIPGNKSNNAAIGGIINRIDDLMTSAAPDTILTGENPDLAAKALKVARSYWGRARKLETVETLVKRGELVGGSQKNQDIAGATRRQLRTILTNEGKARGFTPAELAATERTVMGTVPQRALDAASGLLPTGRLGGLIQGSVGSANLATGNLPGLALQGAGMALGFGAGKAAEALSRKSVNELAGLIARGGVPQPIVQNAVQRLAQSKREALSRALMALGVSTLSQAPAEQ